MRKFITASAFALVLASGYSLASDDLPGRFVDTQQWLPMEEVVSRLTAEGYQLREIEIDDYHYEVKVIAPDGRRLEIDIDPVSGRFLKVDHDD